MIQKEESYSESGGGAGSTQSSKSKKENGYMKFVVFGIIFIVLAVGIALVVM